MIEYIQYKFSEQPLYVIADLHGAFDRIKSFIKEKCLKDCIIVIAGDCGFGFKRYKDYGDTFYLINKFLRSVNITILMIRGNHDDPSYFNNNLINFSNFKAIKDYSVISLYDIEDNEMSGFSKYNILCVGGATSIDRTHRIHNYEKRKSLLIEAYPWYSMDSINDLLIKGYWEDEAPIYNEDVLSKIKEDGIMIECVITHSSPSFCFPIGKDNITYWLNNDNGLEEVIDNERNVMSLIYEKLLNDNHLLTKWVYGHFHYHNEEMIKGLKFITLTNFDSVYDVVEIV